MKFPWNQACQLADGTWNLSLEMESQFFTNFFTCTDLSSVKFVNLMLAKVNGASKGVRIK